MAGCLLFGEGGRGGVVQQTDMLSLHFTHGFNNLPAAFLKKITSVVFILRIGFNIEIKNYWPLIPGGFTTIHESRHEKC